MAYNHYRYSGWCRSPRTTQERRASYDENGNITLGRQRRNANNLTHIWDDLPVTYMQSWKKHRKTQYYPVDI